MPIKIETAWDTGVHGVAQHLLALGEITFEEMDAIVKEAEQSQDIEDAFRVNINTIGDEDFRQCNEIWKRYITRKRKNTDAV